MNNGNINNNNKTNNKQVRCVREHKFTFEELYEAYLSCKKNKRNTINALKFEIDLEGNLHRLVSSLNNKTYKPTRSVCFSITYPKPREVFAADFKDRVVHHALYDHLNPIYEKIFIYDTFACRKNKGTLNAVKRVQSFTRKISNNSKKRAYFLQLDIHNFFMSIDKNILYNILSKKIKDDSLLYLSKIIIFHDPTKDYVQKGSTFIQNKVPKHKSLFNIKYQKGLPIGNLTSQLFANVYLNELDQYIKHKLKIKYYVRYVDDFVFLSYSKNELLFWKKKIIAFLHEKLDLKLKPLEILHPISNGINFVGYIIRPQYLLSRNRNINNFYKKIKSFYSKNVFLDKNKVVYYYDHTSSLVSSINSYLGYIKHAKHKKIIDNIQTKHIYLNNYVFFYNNKVTEKYKNKLCFFKEQHAFFKSFQKNTIVLLDVGIYYRALQEDAFFLKKLFLNKINKKKNYVYVNISKKKITFVLEKIIEYHKSIILTKQTRNNTTYRQIDYLYCLVN